MKKVREITLSGLLDSIESDITLYDKILRDLPIGKKFTSKILEEYYKVSKNVIYGVLQRLEYDKIISREKGYFNGRNNVTVYERIK